MRAGKLARLQRVASVLAIRTAEKMVVCAYLHRLIPMVNTAFTVNGEEEEEKEVRDSASQERNLPWNVRSRTKYKLHSIDTRTAPVQTPNNSTDTNALSAGADSPGEKGACSFFLRIATVSASTFAGFASIHRAHRKIIKAIKG